MTPSYRQWLISIDHLILRTFLLSPLQYTPELPMIERIETGRIITFVSAHISGWQCSLITPSIYHSTLIYNQHRLLTSSQACGEKLTESSDPANAATNFEGSQNRRRRYSSRVSKHNFAIFSSHFDSGASFIPPVPRLSADLYVALGVQFEHQLTAKDVVSRHNYTV